MINLPLIRRLLREGSQVVLLEEGHPPLVVRQLKAEEQPEEVPIASKWPKGTSYNGARDRQEEVLERLNKEILSLKEQLAQEEAEGPEPLT